MLLLFVDVPTWRARFCFLYLVARLLEFPFVFLLGEPAVEWDVELYITDRYYVDNHLIRLPLHCCHGLQLISFYDLFTMVAN